LHSDEQHCGQHAPLPRPSPPTGAREILSSVIPLLPFVP
jgi:hypothetical protein